MTSAIQQVVERHLLPEMATADPVLGSIISQTLNEICRAIPEHPRFWLHFEIDSLLQKTRASAAAIIGSGKIFIVAFRVTSRTDQVR